jgi:Rrf2 family protein
MQLSRTAGYAIRSLVILAEEPDERISVRALHVASGIPQKYLGRLMRRLEGAGLVDVSRGKRGGYRLTREADSLLLSEIVEAVEGSAVFEGCFLGMGSCPVGGPCALHKYWEPIRKTVRDELEQLSLATVANRSSIV